MLLIGLFLLVALVGALVLGRLLLGVWRRLVALVEELGALGERLEQVGAAPAPPDEEGLAGELARLRERYPDVDVEVRRRNGR